MVSIRRSKQVKGESHENKCKREDSLYISLTETKQISVANGNVTFCPHFKYLGSCISFSLWDNHDVSKRIASTNASMVAISAFWDDDHVDVYSKHLIFCSIPCNLLLWGCESWALRQKLLDALEVFLYRSVKQILRINVRHVIEHRIKNDTSVIFFLHTDDSKPNCLSSTHLHREIVRRDSTHSPTRLHTAWCDYPRNVGRPLLLNKQFIV